MSNTKKMPSSLKLERAVLGAAIVDSRCIGTLLELVQDSEIFYEPKHQFIFDAIAQLYSRSDAIDMLTVVEELTKMGKIETVGGAFYVVDLTNDINSGANLETHIRKLQEAYIKRSIILASELMLKEAFNSSSDALEVLSNTQTSILKLAEMLDNKSEHSMKQIVADCLKDMESKSKDSEITGIPSAIRSINTLTAGYQKSDLIILAARPAMGKTAFALNEVRAAAIQHKIPVGFFSLEMSKMQLGKRLISSETGIDSNTIKRPSTLSHQQWVTLGRDVAKLYDAPIFVDDTAGLSIMQLKAKAGRMKAKYGIQMLVIDYLQLIKNPAYKQREQEISSIARELKLLAKELNIPVLALAQLSRAVEQRGDKKPQLSDLRESGAIEQDADIIQFLMRPEYYGIKEDEDGFSTEGMTLHITAKHRNGELADIWMEHDLPHNLYGDIGTLRKTNNMPASADYAYEEPPY